jgi:Cdc6-like AAA superfamily ATPase
LTAARSGLRSKSERTIVVVKGGPGTGKSVVALNVMAELMRENESVQRATGSFATSSTIRPQERGLATLPRHVITW